MRTTLQHIAFGNAWRGGLLLAVVAAAPLTAFAEDAFTLRDTDVYAGPSSEFPQVATLPPGVEVQVKGCLSSWNWCDVSMSGNRGWVYGGDLGVMFENRRVAIIEYGPRVHLPVETFSLQAYWDENYRGRPWYAEREQWSSRVHVQADRGGPPPSGHAAQAQSAPQGGAQNGSTMTSQPAPSSQPGQPQTRTGRTATSQSQAQPQQSRPQEQPGQTQPTQQRPQMQNQAQTGGPPGAASKGDSGPTWNSGSPAERPPEGKAPNDASNRPTEGGSAANRPPEGAPDNAKSSERKPPENRPLASTRPDDQQTKEQTKEQTTDKD